jgi:hypothetical protein
MLYYKTQIKDLKQISEKGDYWVLYLFGTIEYQSQYPKFNRKLHFIKTKSPNYIIELWNHNCIKTISIPEEEIIGISLGQIFNHNGETVHSPSSNDENIIIKQKILISNYKNLKPLDINNFLENTNYPQIKTEKVSDDSILNNFIYIPPFNKNLQIIIHNLTIAKLFYYKSTEIISTILDRNLDKAFLEVEEDQESFTILFDSQELKTKQIEKLVYLLCLKNRSESGFELLNKAIKEFYKNLLNNRFTDTIYPLPFDYPVWIEATCIKLTSKNNELQKYIALNFNLIEPYNNTYNWNIDKKINIADKNDRSSTENRNTKETKGSTGIASNNPSQSLSRFNNRDITNTHLNQVELQTNSEPEFMSCLNIEKIKRDDQQYRYIMDKLVIKSSNALGINIKDSTSTSNTQKANINNISEDNSLLSSIKLLEEASEIVCMDNNYEYEFISINNPQNYFINYIEYGDRKLEIIIVKIYNRDHEFILFDAGKSFYYGFVENMRYRFSNSKELKLLSFLYKMIVKYNFKWSLVYNSTENNHDKEKNQNEILSDFNIKVLQPIKHLEGKVDLATSLAERIIRRIYN